MNRRSVLVEGLEAVIEWSALENTVQATIEGRRYELEVQQVQPGVFWFVHEGRSIEVTVSERNPSFLVSIGNHQIPVEFIDSVRARRRGRHAAHEGAVEVRAPMPGKIVRLLVAEAAEVDVNQAIVVMEAMKMQNEIRSPKRGVVRGLTVKEGAAVNANDLIASVE